MSEKNTSLLFPSAPLLCRVFGHFWKYKDYTNWITPKGDPYRYKRSRKCKRCDHKQVSCSLTENVWEDSIPGEYLLGI
ncbi:MAG: hypothetical protein ACHQNT_09490 [Bacteroidia bacterium]